MADTTVQSVTSLLPFQQEGLKDLYERTKTQVDAGLPIYQGQRVAPMDQSQLAAIQQMQQYATGVGQQSADAALGANNFWMDPSRVYDLNSVPGYSASRQGIEQSVGRMLTEQALPQIRGSQILNNQLGNSRAGYAEADAVQKATEALTAGLGNLDLNTAQMILQANQQAIGRAPQIIQAGTIPANIGLTAGGLLQNQQQAEIDAGRQKFEEEANAPYFGLDQLRASLGLMNAGSRSTQTTDQADPSWIQTLAGLALLGKSTGLLGGGGGGISVPGYGGGWFGGGG